ncbi:ribosomal protein S18 acetylase RimI-like enzyme [Peribacillus simplex]|uniref:GNAT family N-acetyltransferase n=1 Tax=Peribacillus simplex TaxID=1478 RepID=UPI0024E2279F|nr:GNAT family N-acetyltransferase [Peribacillus simplex]MDF9759578.1 ribosomal protein S18 acetylase RimI-like enzyme [Peribacillus simplex]
MEIKFAEVSDAPIIHDLMIKAFMEYKDEVPPSSALEETVQSVLIALKDGEQGLISYVDNQPVGMVRFQLKEDGLYFYRLSVIPEKQCLGIAKKILRSLEDFAIKKEVTTIFCKVRMTVPKNIKLYSSIGYGIYDEEVVHKPNGINIKVVSMMKKLS